MIIAAGSRLVRMCVHRWLHCKQLEKIKYLQLETTTRSILRRLSLLDQIDLNAYVSL